MVRRVPTAQVEQPQAASAADDRVVQQVGRIRVLDRDAAVGAIDDDVVDDDRRSLVPQDDPVIVGAHDEISLDDRRAAGRIDRVVVLGIPEDIVTDPRRRRALAPEVHVVVVAAFAREVAVLDPDVRIAGVDPLPDLEESAAADLRGRFAGMARIVGDHRQRVPLGAGPVVRQSLKRALVDINVAGQHDHGFMVISRPRFVVILMSPLAVGILDEAMIEPAVGGLDEQDLLPRDAVAVMGETDRLSLRPPRQKPALDAERHSLLHQDECPRPDRQHVARRNHNGIVEHPGARQDRILGQLARQVARRRSVENLHRTGIHVMGVGVEGGSHDRVQPRHEGNLRLPRSGRGIEHRRDAVDLHRSGLIDNGGCDCRDPPGCDDGNLAVSNSIRLDAQHGVQGEVAAVEGCVVSFDGQHVVAFPEPISGRPQENHLRRSRFV